MAKKDGKVRCHPRHRPVSVFWLSLGVVFGMITLILNQA